MFVIVPFESGWSPYLPGEVGYLPRFFARQEGALLVAEAALPRFAVWPVVEPIAHHRVEAVTVSHSAHDYAGVLVPNRSAHNEPNKSVQ